MATAGASASSAAVSSASAAAVAACPSTVAPFALRKNYVTLKQLQDLRLKEQFDEEKKLRDCDFNIKGAEAARSSRHRPPRGFRRRAAPWPAPLSISELTGRKGTADDSAPAFAIGESAGGDGKRAWKGKDTLKSDAQKRAGPEESSENPIPANKEGNGRNRSARAQLKLTGVSGDEPKAAVLESERASRDKPISAKEGKGQNRQASLQPKLPGISGGASEVMVIESEEASRKNHIPVRNEGERRNRHRASARRKRAGVSGGDAESKGASSKNPFPMKKVGEDQHRPKLTGISTGGPEVSTTESKKAPSKNPIPMKKVTENQNRRRAMAQPKLAGVSCGQPEVVVTDESSSRNPIPMNKEREVQNQGLTQPKLAYFPCNRPEPSVQVQQQGFKGGEEAITRTPRKASNPVRGGGRRFIRCFAHTGTRLSIRLELAQVALLFDELSMVVLAVEFSVVGNVVRRADDASAMAAFEAALVICRSINLDLQEVYSSIDQFIDT
ncbi:hypothetical protein ZIOFF_031008 [Zingiber officinale]|uniref:Uncharacterized protein n=1 Tax=Zingiber officinale TaxID=94328 RepID=A0A8J5GWD4_ZINOF|nr:hypothetical protein ZIOFF_031008 [Zingiber officinale]